MADDSTLGLGLDNPAYQDLITKQQEAIKAANQPYGMNAGQGAIAAGLGLLPALIGGLVRGREGLAIGAQAGLAGVGSYDSILKENFERQSKAEAANADLYGQQAQQLAQSALQDQRFLKQEKLRQQNRIELREMFPPARGGTQGISDEPISAIERSSLAKALGVDESEIDNVTSDQAELLLKAKDRELRGKDQAGDAENRERMAKETERRQKEQEMRTDERSLEGYEWVDGKRPSAEEHKVARAVNEGGRLLMADFSALRNNFAKYGENAVFGKGAAEQQIILKRMLEHARIYNKAGASFTDLEAQLSRVVENVNNVGFAKAIFNSALFGKTPLKQLNAAQSQLKGEILSRMRSNKYVYTPPKQKAVSSDVFNQLKGAASGR